MKFRYKNKLIAALAGVSMLAATGCKKYLDVNENPNAPKTATDNLILPSTQAAIGMAVGNNLQVFGGFYAQYWTQNPTSSQYKTIDQYQSNSSTFDRVWGILYNDALQDITLLEQSKNTNYVAIALIEKAYIFQLLTDAFGDVPLKDALKGNNNLAPQYDSQQEVYDSIFAWTKRGVALSTVATSNYPGTDDIVFGGGAAGMANWKRFGNTLLLRAYLHLSQVDAAKARAGVAELYATSPAFLTTDAKISYQNVGGNQNPLYAEGVGLGRTQNIVASSTAVNALARNNDPRLKVFYTTNAAGNVVGIAQGSFGTQPAVAPTFPAPVTGARFAAATGTTAAVAAVKLISAPESYFLQAEAVARGWAIGNVDQLFKAGIKASFDTYGLSSESYTTYIATAPDAQLPADVEGKIRVIVTQKYFAMIGTQGFEAWTEWRRTGYPNILVASRASALGTAELPARLLYPDTEITRNTNFPGLKLITEKVWWDK
ncbi:MAG: SusD/RagB family nutrient-binding outer rane lipoprotein [Segetibacter sp.]|nr:SusD/RagB family nutrient-binding outer rane lipoprotein [Segetibacter sp.]